MGGWADTVFCGRWYAIRNAYGWVVESLWDCG